MYKVSKGMTPPQITELFVRGNEHPYNLWYNAELLQPFVNSVRCGTESIWYLGQKILGMVPDTYKNTDSLYNFKKIIKNGSLKTDHAELARNLQFVKNLGVCETAWIVMFLRPVAFYLIIFYFIF